MAILGTVVSINGAPEAVGKVLVISDGGVKRVLHLNDGVKTGDTIITPEGVIVELELAIPPGNGRLNKPGRISSFAKLLRVEPVNPTQIKPDASETHYGVAVQFCRAPKLAT